MEVLQTSRIDPLILKENHNLVLNFPGKGIIPTRITEREEVIYRYPYGILAANEWKAAAKLGLTSQTVSNILEVKKKNELLHLFRGMFPSAVRTYLNYPVEIPRNRLPRVTRDDRSDMGYVDGFESPESDPSPKTEVFIPYNLDVAFALFNPLDIEVSLYINLVSYRYRFQVIKDLDTVMGILSNRVPCRIATLGGLEGFAYSIDDTFGINAIPFGSTREDVVKALASELAGGGD